MFDEGHFTIQVVRVHNAAHDAFYDKLNNNVLHSYYILCKRAAAAIAFFLNLLVINKQLIKKVMFEQPSNETLTFCIHAGYDISITANFRFRYSTEEK